MGKRIFAIAIALAMLVVMAVPVGVSAETDTSNVTGSIGATYTIDAPTTIALGTLSTSAPVSSASQSITATTNDTASGGLHHVVIGVNGVDGKLALGGSGAALDPVLKIASTQIGWTAQDLSASKVDGSVSTDLSATAGTKTFNDVVITQPQITTSSPASGSYSETITFTATFSGT
jgi:hypothetical protein